MKNKQDVLNGEPYEHALVCYTSYQQEYHEWPQYAAKSLTFYRGFPSESELLQHPIAEKGTAGLLVVDDFCQNDEIYPLLTKVFTTYSHHNNISVIFISHGVFLKNRLSVFADA